MRGRLVSLLMLLPACNTSGTQAEPPSEAGTDATMGDASGDAEDASEDAGDAIAPCVSIVAANPVPSQDCFFGGSCPADCAGGTAAAYLCSVASVAVDAGLYPSAFQAPTGIVSIVGFETASYPWDAAAWVSCGPLACVRWATADHVNGSSSWPSDPCAGDGGGPLAWVCPPYAGVQPPTDAGCINAGDMNVVGGGEAGTPPNTIWCCPGVPVPPMEGGSPEAAAPEGGSGDGSTDAATDAGAGD